MPAKIVQWAEYENYEPAEWQKSESRVSEELKSCPGLERHGRSKLEKFLKEQEISSIQEMDYKLRIEYEKYISINPNRKQMYLRGYDQVMQYVIQNQMQTLEGKRKYQWRYKNETLFLRYYPDPAIAAEFLDSRNMECLIWNFEKNCSEVMKRQVFQALTCILKNVTNTMCRRAKLLALQYLYSYCREKSIKDIEELEETDIEQYREYIDKNCSNKTVAKQYMAVLNICRRESFVQSDEIHWHAGVWYIERLHLPEYRLNQSSSRKSISFLEIHDPVNRRYAQEFMKYELGINGQAVSTVIQRYVEVRHFIEYMEGKGVRLNNCTEKLLEGYFRHLQDKKLDAKGYNERVLEITYFIRFLTVKRYLKPIPFYPEYYYQKVLPVHHNRSVKDEVSREIIRNLKNFPEHLRCMFLHLWCLGLRASEVCTLKGDAYYWQGEDPWIKIYQVKMKSYKRIPIPKGLYDVMNVYLEKHKIRPDEYVFKNKKGGAFLYQTFRQQMLKYCEINQIQNGEYLFQSHDYRHTVATIFYDSGVSLQSIRDYLGHLYDEMTRQYIDYMPKKVEQANTEYFLNKENDLAARWKKGDSYGRKKDLL